MEDPWNYYDTTSGNVEMFKGPRHIEPLNYGYSAHCIGSRYDGVADCGHPACGILCDMAILKNRSTQEYTAWREAKLDQCFRLVEEGLSLRAAAQAVGVSDDVAYRAAQRRKVALSGGRPRNV